MCGFLIAGLAGRVDIGEIDEGDGDFLRRFRAGKPGRQGEPYDHKDHKDAITTSF